jgi:lysophospholipase L1-like esterase
MVKARWVLTVAAGLILALMAGGGVAEAVIPVDPGSSTVNLILRSNANGDYVSAELGYGGANAGMLRARAATQGSWEQWEEVSFGNGTIALLSNANGLYVSAELGYSGSDYAELRARASSVGPWETFQIVWNADGTYSLRSTANGLYVSAELGYSGNNYAELRARASAIGDWEEFTTNTGGSSCTDYGARSTGPNGCQGFSTGSTWFSGGGVGLHGQEIWTYANGSMRDSTATYSLSGLDNSHPWQLQAYIPNAHSDATHAHYRYCTTGHGCGDGYVNQNVVSNQWVVFATSVCSDDGTASIVLADDGGDVYPAQVGADAITAVAVSGPCAISTPPVPTNVTAAASNATTIHVTWTDNSGGTAQYVISNSQVSVQPNLPVGTTSFDWTGLARGIYMCFTLKAVNSLGVSSAWSAYGCATIPQVPATPTGVTATPVSGDTIHVTWTDPSGGTAQFVLGNGNTSTGTISAGTTSYNWGGLSPGTYMCFDVRAVNSIGDSSGWSAYGCATIPTPPTPTGVTATAKNASTVHVTWTDTSGGTAQFVVANGTTSSPNLSPGTTAYDWGGLTRGVSTCFWVKSVNSIGVSSAWSSPSCVTIPVVPSAPAAVTATASSPSTIHLTWSDPSGGTTTFVVNSPNATSPVLPTGTTSYDWTGLTPGTSVCFTVTAKNSIGDSSPPSATGCATIPPVPTAPILVNVAVLDTATIHVAWSDLSNGTAQYEVSDGTTSQTTGFGATSLDWGGLQPDTRVCFQVRGVNISGTSDWRPGTASSLCATTAPTGSTTPTPATTVTASATASYLIHLSWADTSGGGQYEIDNGSVSMFTAAGATSFDWGGLNPGTTMCFRIRAVTVNGSSPWAPSATPSACATTPALSCQASNDVPDPSGFVDLYHGTSLAAADNLRDHGIDITQGERYVDFGQGFYVTTDINQARAWANRNFTGQTPSVVHYRVALSDLSPGGLCGLVFNPPTSGTDGYLAFVRAMRTFQPTPGGAGYDFVEGPLLDNPFDFLSGQADARYLGQQDSVHSARAVALLNSDYVEILPAVTAGQVGGYAIVGDSYSSGVGAGPYDSGTNTSTNSCLRSANAFGRVYAAGPPIVYPASSVQHAACSGATVTNLTTTGQYGEAAQISQIDPQSALVTVTIGGNDVGFASVLQTCIKAIASRTGCEDYYSQNDANNLSNAIDALQPSLVSTYEAIRTRAPGATVVAVTYPNVFLPGSSATSCLNIGFISDSDVAWLINTTAHLDNVIVDAANQAGIQVLDERYAFAGHELCSATPWVNGLLDSLQNLDRSSSFHPNASGQAQLAADLSAFLTTPAAATPAAWTWRKENDVRGIPDLDRAREMLADPNNQDALINKVAVRVDHNYTLAGGDARFNIWSTVGCGTQDEVRRRDGEGVLPGPGNCLVEQGTWQSPYDLLANQDVVAHNRDEVTGQTPGVLQVIQIDHVVNLHDAWDMGAWDWTDEQRSGFGNNYTSLPELLTVSRTINRAKSDRTIDAWTPPNTDFVCTFARMYTVDLYWSFLELTQAEYDELHNILFTQCS